MKKYNMNTDEPNKKKNSLPIIITISVLLLFSCCCCGGIGIVSGNKEEDSESSSASEASNESSVAETTESLTEETTIETSTITTSETTEVTTEQETTEKTTVSKTESETTTTATEISSENFINAIKEATEGAVGKDEYITDIFLTDGTLTISVDISKSNPIIPIPLEDLAVSCASSITDAFLELEQYDELWNEIIIDFGDVGFVSRTKNDIVEDKHYGFRYFEIDELGSEAPNHKKAEHSDYEITSLKLKHGELLEYTTIAGPLVIKAKIEPSLTNELTINQNYINVADVILNQGGNNFDEIQYWAVADMADSSESKVIQFTLDKNTIDSIYNGDIIDIELGDYVTDLYILPSLKK